jgi:hypothetical protein
LHKACNTNMGNIIRLWKPIINSPIHITQHNTLTLHIQIYSIPPHVLVNHFDHCKAQPKHKYKRKNAKEEAFSWQWIC